MRTLSKSDLEQLVSGACFFGSGGGGPLLTGRQLVATLPDDAAIRLATVAEAAADPRQLTAVVAFIGEPSAAAGETMSAVPGLNAFDALNTWCRSAMQKSIGYIVAVEIGAVNAVAACVVAQQRGIAALDADCAGGRSVPALELATPSTFGVSASPTFVANDASQVIQVNGAGGRETDDIIRGIISAPELSDIAGIALWVMTSDQVATALPSQGTVTRAIRYGAVLTTPPVDVDQIFAMLAGDFPVLERWRGRVLPVTPATAAGGFDFGKVRIDLDDSDATLTLINQNENLLMWASDAAAPLVLLPDSLNYLGTNGQVMSNVEIVAYAGKEIWVIGIRAQPFMVNDAVTYILSTGASYFGPYVPLAPE